MWDCVTAIVGGENQFPLANGIMLQSRATRIGDALGQTIGASAIAVVVVRQRRAIVHLDSAPADRETRHWESG